MNMREKKRFKGRNLRERTRRLLAVFLCVCMMLTIMPAMPGNIVNVKAAGKTPSVTAYATKTQLMDGTFAPDSEGKSTTVGKLVFGKNSSRNPQEWYILGKDTVLSGDNTIIFATDTIKNQQFNPERNEGYAPDARINIPAIQNSASDSRKTLINTYSYTDRSTHDEVYINHYGISSLRVALRDMAEDTSYFSVTEQAMMNATKVITRDACNSVDYSTEDKLYAPSGVYRNQYCSVGSGDSKIIHSSIYFDNANNDKFWTRSPVTGEDSPDISTYYCNGVVVMTFGNPGKGQGYLRYVNRVGCVRPVTNLNLTNVLFASAAKAASSNTPTAETISSGTAMTLRLDGSGKKIGIVEYNTTNNVITAQNDVDAAGPVSLVIQGKNDETDWFYSVKLGSKTVVTKAQIEAACGISDISLADCKIWLETTIDNVTYAKEATQKNDSPAVTKIASVEVTGIDAPVANEDFDTVISCSTTGIAKTSITFLTTGENGEEEASGKADWNKSYKAKITLNPGAVGNAFYEFNSSVSVTVNSGTLGVESSTVNPDGTLTIITLPFTNTAKRKIESVTPPTVPSTFTNYYDHEGYDPILTNGGNGELGTQANVTFETNVRPTKKAMDVTWTIESAGGGGYDNTPGASNIFRWTITDASAADYNITTCPGYDSTKNAITGTVTIANQAATPVAITGTDSSIEYTGEVIDVSQYFNIDANAGSATYSDVTVSGDGKGVGTLVGSQLTVTRTGEFQIKVNTAPNGIYAAGEKTITLTVANGTIQYTATDYSGTYDEQAHSISVNVASPTGTTITYSTDGESYGADNPSFTDIGTYTVHYRITKENYDTINGSKTVTIGAKPSSGGGGIIGGGDNTSQFWPGAKKELEQALSQEPGKEPPVVTIHIKDNTTVPKDVLETIKGKNIEVVFDLGNGISWKLNGNDIKNISSDIDLGVNKNTTNIPAEVINKVTKEKTSLQLSLNHNGDFGFTATLTVNLDSKNKGLYANLYYYNPKAAKGKELEFISAGKIDGSGNADLQFTHASDYVIVIDRTPANDTTITKEKWTVNSNIMNKLAKLGWQNSALKVQWSKVEGAEGYDIYATTYGGKITAKTKVASVTANKTSLSISKVLGKKVSNQTGYKVRVKAYRMVNGKKQYLGETMDLFTVGTKHKAYTNVSKVTPKNATITLTVGKKQKVTTTLTKADQKKKLLPTKFVAVRRYFVEDSTIVKVDQNGNLTALKKGKTTLYIKAANGTTAKVTITVK